MRNRSRGHELYVLFIPRIEGVYKLTKTLTALFQYQVSIKQENKFSQARVSLRPKFSNFSIRALFQHSTKSKHLLHVVQNLNVNLGLCYLKTYISSLIDNKTFAPLSKADESLELGN